ncbi:MAG: DEAD/DEAH box helicase [Pseudomonadales bacterium]|nr:DEAD/DEAH box helicase [Pseudomonadales bacterium]MBO6594757.1 DEAD/DEAH box helicase [Pseudomonadales bacterium]MBO6656562.1 DEAD/DEAH box helicase [Pseudomonadales bacterium]MBO6821683.1 DEAD/DEAH box helicase [Pseudomonadales bacterium]
MSFQDLGLIKPLLSSLYDQGYKDPTPIQKGSIQTVLAGHDLMATAQTGTGKTAAFTLPIIQKLTTAPKERRGKLRALILTPTRELAGQIQESVRKYGKNTQLRSFAVFGGVKIGPQIKVLKNGIDILVATPGRLLDLHQQRAVDLRDIEVFVLDEADRMLDMGFIPDVKRIREKLPEKKQTLMFSATFSGNIRELAETMLNDPELVDVAPRNSTAKSVSQTVIPVEKARKLELLKVIAADNQHIQALVFTKTKHGANKVAKSLNKAGIRADAIHGNKSQAHRNRALKQFKSGELAILVATDIASRGLDINQLPLVINFELPHVAEDYVHRIGRTGRAGNDGHALSLVSHDEAKLLHAIEKLSNQNIDREEIEGFEPVNQLPFRKERKPQREGTGQGDRSKGSKRRRPSRNRRSNQNRSNQSRSNQKSAGPRRRKAA